MGGVKARENREANVPGASTWWGFSVVQEGSYGSPMLA